MNRTVQYYNLQSGDEIVVPKSKWNIVKHHAVYLGQDHNGTDLIIENNVIAGVRLVKADTFFSEVPFITKIERFQGNHYQRVALVENALRLLGKPYDLISFNCEHLSNTIRNGVPRSKQVDNSAYGLLGVLGVLFFGSLLSR